MSCKNCAGSQRGPGRCACRFDAHALQMAALEPNQRRRSDGASSRRQMDLSCTIPAAILPSSWVIGQGERGMQDMAGCDGLTLGACGEEVRR